jgi:hypothetical protein
LTQGVDVNNNMTKTYQFPVYYNATGFNQWRTLLPLTSGIRTANDIGVQINVNNGETQLFLIRFGSGTTPSPNNVTIAMNVYQDRNDPVTITEMNGDFPGTTAQPLYNGTQITQDYTNQVVGINTLTPDASFELDVNGSIKATALNVSGNVTSGNLSTNVIRATAMTGNLVNVSGNVTSGNLSTNSISATAITASGPFTVNSSNNTFDAMSTVTLTRTIAGTTVGSGVDIGTIGELSTISGSTVVELRIISNTANNQVTKAYTIPFNANYAWTGARRALPITSIVARTNDVGVDVLSSDNTLVLKLVRTTVDAAVDASTPYQISLVVHYNKDSGYTLANSWTPSSSAYTSTIPAILERFNVAPGTAITQHSTTAIQPFTGILTDNPQYHLDINGSTRVGANLIVMDTVIANAVSTNALYAPGTNHQIDGTKYFSANVVLSNATALSGNVVANVYCIGSTTLEIDVLQQTSFNQTAMKYFVPFTPGLVYNGGNWMRALPESGGNEATSQNTLALDLQTPAGASNFLNIALLRKAVNANVNTGSVISMSIKASSNKYSGDVRVTWINTPYTGFTPSTFDNYYLATPICKSGNRVGIFTDNASSQYRFDCNVYGGFRQGVWIENGTLGGGLSFGNLWRIYLNPTTQNLEIQYNNDTNDYTWTSNVVTGILASR